MEGVQALAGNGASLGSVALRQMGVISGNAQLQGRDDHVGIDVYVPGTSFGAKTDGEGYFKISYVPQGRYRVRVEKDGWQGVYRENVIVEAAGDEVPVTLLVCFVK